MSNQEMVVIIRPSFKKLCGPDACRAAVYNHILYRLARKAKDEPDKKVREGEVFWFASAEDICQDMDEAWCVNKMRKEIKALVDSGLLGQRHNPVKRWDRKFQYYIGKEQGKKLLELSQKQGVCLLHIGLNAEVLHLLHMVNAFTKYGACKCQKEEMHLPNMALPSTKYGGAIPEGSSLEGSTEGSTEGSEEKGALELIGSIASAHARALFADDVANLPDEPLEDDPEATVKAPVTPKALKVVPEQTSSQAREGKHERNDAAATDGIGSEPRASGKGATQEKPKRGGKKPTQVQLTLHEQEIKEWYEELRGIEVSFSKRNVAALQALGKRTMTKDDFLNVTAILDGDKWFEEHKIGVDLYWIDRQWENKIIFLQRRKNAPLADAKPGSAPGTSDFDIYKGNGPEERAALLAHYDELEKNGQLLI